MRYIIVAILLILTTMELKACSCGRGWGRNFLNNIEHFDIIALGKLKTEINSWNQKLVVEKIYKGSSKIEILEISNGSMCDNYLTYEDGDRVILGLTKVSGNPNYFHTFGCVTTSISVKAETVSTLNHQLPLFGKPRIGIFKRKMNIKRLERRIKRKIWWNNLI